MLTRLTSSLSGRLVITASLFLLLFLSLTGLALDRAFRNSAETALMERLLTHIYTLLAAADHEEGKLMMPILLQDPGFNQINSGLYGIIHDNQGATLWRSQSTLSLPLEFRSRLHAGEHRYQALELGGERLLAYSYGVIWESEDSTEYQYTFTVLRSDAPVIAEINGFRATLWRWLGGICLVLLALQWGIMRWSLRPVHRLADDLRQIELGTQERLQGDYPTELRGVAANLNHLIVSERSRRQRYRNTLADLAHSLKTPLAVLRGQVANAPLSKVDGAGIDEQIEAMSQIISYQLQRPTAPEQTILSRAVPLRPPVEKLLRNLSKVYADKTIQYEMEIAPECKFYGDEQDLLEILGNLLDNAFKYCRSRVFIRADSEQQQNSNQGLSIQVEDDGSGIAPAQRQAVLQRGIRADSQHPGQGIGLAVAHDIIAGYHGSLEIDNSALGGALFRVRFGQ